MNESITKDLVKQLIKQTYRRAYAESMFEVVVNVLPKSASERQEYLSEVASTMIETGE